MSPLSRKLLGATAYSAAVAASMSAGAPAASDLPQIALGWPVLLHIERAVAIVGLIALAGLILWRASHGELPVRFGNIEYAVEAAAAEAEGIALNQEERLLALERAVGIRSVEVVSRPDGA